MEIDPVYRLRQRQATPIAILLILVTLAAILWYGSTERYLLCDMECGETTIALKAAQQYSEHGVQFALIENEGSFEDPQLYTHNVNIGDFLAVFLAAIGFAGIKAAAIGSAVVHGTGLFYIYLTVLLISESALAALITLAVFASTYWGFDAFALNPLRVWHTLAFFMLAFHGTRLTQRQPAAPADLAGIIAGALIAFGCGYDFWLICAAASASILVFQAIGRLRPRRFVDLSLFLGLAFAIPFVLRQVQIIYGLGADYWWKDLLFSLAIKIPGASRLIAIPPIADIDAFYKARHIMRPPASPANDWSQILQTAEHMVGFVTVPRWGVVSLTLFGLLLLLGLASRLHLVPRRFPWPAEVERVAGRLLLPTTVGVCVGLAVFAPFSLHVYLKHEFPLLGFLILPARAMALFWLVSIALQQRRRSVTAVAAAGVIFLVFDTVVVHLNALANGFYPNFGYLPFIQRHENARIFLSTVHTDLVTEAIFGLDRANIQRIPSSSAYATLQRIRSDVAHNPTDLPDFWIYQPVEQRSGFDSPQPNCRWQDWILAVAERLHPATARTPALEQAWLSPTYPGPGSVISFGGTIRNLATDDDLSLALRGPLVQVGEPTYNCIYGSLVGWAGVTQPEKTVAAIRLSDRRRTGEVFELYDYEVSVVPTPLVIPPIGPFERETEPSIASLIAAAPDLKVVERSEAGLGYVVFQLPVARDPGATPGQR